MRKLTNTHTAEEGERAIRTLLDGLQMQRNQTVYVLEEKTRGGAQAWMRFFVIDKTDPPPRIVEITARLARLVNVTTYDRHGKWYVRTHSTNAQDMVEYFLSRSLFNEERQLHMERL